MKRALTLGVGLLALAGTSFAAQAADLRPITKAPPPAPAPVADWTGFYAGVGVGGRWTDTDWTTTCLLPTTAPGCPANNALFPTRFLVDNPSSFDMSGVRVSGYLGYNWQISTWVLGLEGDFGWADNKDNHIGIPGTHILGSTALDTASVRDRWDASVRGRVGYLVTPQALLYATGGAAWLDKETTATCPLISAAPFAGGWCVAGPHAESFSKTMFGWTVGAGAEWKFWQNWILRAEYRYSDYTGDAQNIRFFAGTPVDTFDAHVRQTTHTAYLGVSYLFNWIPPVAAKY